ncbi:DNA polymerase III subunit delta [Patescibacteria group bacterium]|nr:DNA polymerase III subunit delta [Patescibacteria group bacterium]
MIIFLYGKDTYRLQRKLKEIETRYKKIHKGGLNLEKIEVGQIDFREFWDKFRQPSMFIKKKLFFLENLFSNQRFKEEFRKKIQPIAKSQDIVVVFEKKELPQKDKLFLSLKKYGKSQKFQPLGGRALKTWIKNEFQKEGVEVPPKVVDFFSEFVGNDLWLLSNEIKKISLYKRKEKKVEISDIESLVRPKIEADIFKTVEALANKEKRKALKLIQKHLEKGDSPLYLLKMINFQFRNLLIACSFKEDGKTLSDLLQLKLSHPYVAKKSWLASHAFTLSQLKKIYQRIFEADFTIKTGKITPEIGLKMLITQL